MTDRNFLAVRAKKGTELARGVVHEDGTTEVTLQGRLVGFPTLTAAELALEQITSSDVEIVWPAG